MCVCLPQTPGLVLPHPNPPQPTPSQSVRSRSGTATSKPFALSMKVDKPAKIKKMAKASVNLKKHVWKIGPGPAGTTLAWVVGLVRFAVTAVSLPQHVERRRRRAPPGSRRAPAAGAPPASRGSSPPTTTPGLASTANLASSSLRRRQSCALRVNWGKRRLPVPPHAVAVRVRHAARLVRQASTYRIRTRYASTANLASTSLRTATILNALRVKRGKHRLPVPPHANGPRSPAARP